MATTPSLTVRVNMIDADLASIKGEIKAIKDLLAGGIKEDKLNELLGKFDHLMDLLGDMARPVDPAILPDAASIA